MNSSTASTSSALRPGETDVVDAKELTRQTDTRGPIWMGFWVLIVGLGLFLAWAAWAPLDEGVSAPAVVTVEGRRKTIQHMQGGVVQRVLVKDGAMVKEGDVVIELDAATARAAYQGIRQAYLSQRALEGRVLAETTGAASIVFHPDLTGEKDAMAIQHMAAQQQLFAVRRSARTADLAAIEQTIAGLEGQMTGLREVVSSRRAQQTIQTQHVANVRALADEGFAPRNQALQLEQAQVELRTSLVDLENNLFRLQSAIAESRLRLMQRRNEYAREASAELANVRRDVQANQEKLAAATLELERMEIKTPVGGQVLGLAIAGPGGVVSPGQHLMDILPTGESLKLEVRIPPHVIDRISVGNEVEVRFANFAATPHLLVLGKVESLSGDALTEALPGGATHSFFAGRVVLTPEGLKALAGQTVQPGMTAEVVIRTGERSLLTYLLHPLLKRVSSAMTEP